jgi:hypothetical protein
MYILLIFCFWSNTHLPLFSGMSITFAQTEELIANTETATTILDESNSVLDESNSVTQPITTDPAV